MWSETVAKLMTSTIQHDSGTGGGGGDVTIRPQHCIMGVVHVAALLASQRHVYMHYTTGPPVLPWPLVLLLPGPLYASPIPTVPCSASLYTCLSPSTFFLSHLYLPPFCIPLPASGLQYTSSPLFTSSLSHLPAPHSAHCRRTLHMSSLSPPSPTLPTTIAVCTSPVFPETPQELN
ncbi:hypothetical protein E2C01_073625 [Portunus trituberculatus]|uniref:Uncharacterized protein n=1 Tax=Portunus trituberculatus TaxID=210409 RepID=A0A5B7I5U2_PORTR|nr:hypothetical protein [Portunus trituberculatus]